MGVLEQSVKSQGHNRDLPYLFVCRYVGYRLHEDDNPHHFMNMAVQTGAEGNSRKTIPQSEMSMLNARQAGKASASRRSSDSSCTAPAALMSLAIATSGTDVAGQSIATGPTSGSLAMPPGWPARDFVGYIRRS